MRRGLGSCYAKMPSIPVDDDNDHAETLSVLLTIVLEV